MLKKITTAIVLCTAVLLSSCSRQNDFSEADDSVKVFTSILPQKYFVERIGGDRVSVDVLVQPGKSPATYEPTPSQVIKLSGSDVFFSIGVPFEEGFLENLEDSLKTIIIKDTSEGVEKRSIDKHFHENNPENNDIGNITEGNDNPEEEIHLDNNGEHEDQSEEGHRAGYDPHIWLSVTAAGVMAENIYKTLSEIDPENRTLYKDNFDNLLSDLKAAGKEIKEMLRPYKGMSFFVFHPSFGYFADEYGLEQIAVESGGKEPSPASLEKIITEARLDNIRVIIAQPEFSQKSAEVIAEAINGKVLLLNPLNPDYFNNLKMIAEGIKSAFDL